MPKVSDLRVKTTPLRKSICHQILQRGGFIKNKNKIQHIQEAKVSSCQRFLLIKPHK